MIIIIYEWCESWAKSAIFFLVAEIIFKNGIRRTCFAFKLLLHVLATSRIFWSKVNIFFELYIKRFSVDFRPKHFRSRHCRFISEQVDKSEYLFLPQNVFIVLFSEFSFINYVDKKLSLICHHYEFFKIFRIRAIWFRHIKNARHFFH